MSIRDSRLLAVFCVLATVSGYGCESNGGWQEERIDRIRPTRIGFNGIAEPSTNTIDYFARGVTLQPAVVTPQLAPSGTCPTHSFVAPIRVVAVADADADLFLNQVEARFVDRKGIPGGITTVSRTDLVGIFGSTRVPRLGTRVFPLTLPFGCVPDTIGTLTVSVFTGDSFGRVSRRSFDVDVR